MVQLVRLAVDEDTLTQLAREPLIVGNGRQLVQCSYEEADGHTNLIYRDSRWLDLPVLVHVLDRAEVVAQPRFLVQHRLHVVDDILVAVACRVVLDEHVPPLHVVGLLVASGGPVEELGAECHQGVT